MLDQVQLRGLSWQFCIELTFASCVCTLLPGVLCQDTRSVGRSLEQEVLYCLSVHATGNNHTGYNVTACPVAMNVACCAVALSVSKPDSGKSAVNPGIMNPVSFQTPQMKMTTGPR